MVKKEVTKLIKENEQVRETLLGISELGFEKKEVAEKFEEMLQFDVIQNQEDMALQAALLTKAYFVANMERPTFDFKALVIRADEPRKFIQKKDGKENTIATGKAIGFKVGKEEEGLKLLDITVFRENAEKIRQLKKGKFYQFNASGDLAEDGETYNVGFEDSTTIAEISDIPEELKEATKDEHSIHQLLKTKYPIVDLAEAEMKVDDKYHMIEGIVVNGMVRPTKDGTRMYGRIVLMDDSLTAEDFKRMKGGFSVMVPPEEVRHSNLSKIGILCKFNSSPEYGVGANGEATFRIWGNAREPQPGESPEALGVKGADGNKPVMGGDAEEDDVDF